MRTGFEDKEHGKISSAVGLPKSRINIIARDIPLFSETNPRSTEQYLASFPHSYAMFCCEFVFNCFWTNDLLNMNDRDPFIAFDPNGIIYQIAIIQKRKTSPLLIGAKFTAQFPLLNTVGLWGFLPSHSVL
ncbi:MAG: hypothetical protein R3C14_18850 [Caldilineaceae bacterium]